MVLLKNLEGNSWSRCNFGVLGGNKIRDGGDRGGGDTLERDEGGKSFGVFLVARRNISSASSVMRIGAIREDG